MAVSNIAGLLGSLEPVGLGLVAEAAGLRTAMWLLLAGPLALLVGLPRSRWSRVSWPFDREKHRPMSCTQTHPRPDACKLSFTTTVTMTSGVAASLDVSEARARKQAVRRRARGGKRHG